MTFLVELAQEAPADIRPKLAEFKKSFDKYKVNWGRGGLAVAAKILYSEMSWIFGRWPFFLAIWSEDLDLNVHNKHN